MLRRKTNNTQGGLTYNPYQVIGSRDAHLDECWLIQLDGIQQDPAGFTNGNEGREKMKDTSQGQEQKRRRCADDVKMMHNWSR